MELVENPIGEKKTGIKCKECGHDPALKRYNGKIMCWKCYWKWVRSHTLKKLTFASTIGAVIGIFFLINILLKNNQPKPTKQKFTWTISNYKK